ncbi:MAG: AAA family ATPase, partial [Anaerolineales bacterium]
GEISIVEPLSLLTEVGDVKELSRDLDLTHIELALSQIRNHVNLPLMNQIRRTIEDWTIFRGFGERALENIHQAQAIEVVNPLRLKPDGSNLASVLHNLANEAQYADANDHLQDLIRLAFPDFDRLALVTAGTGRVELQWRTKNRWQFPAQALSDGMLRFLGLAVLLNLPDMPPLIAIYEPEVGLHPRLIPLLAGMLKAASQRTQIVVTTHNPELLNAPDIELDDIVLVDNVEGETTLKRVENDDYLEMWLKKYSGQFGRLWVMGKLR